MDSSLNGKTIVVTGAGQGIGYELTKRLVAAGSHVIAISIIQEQLDQLKAECSDSVTTVLLDLTNWNQTREVLGKVLTNVSVYGLVNNAGITIVKPFLEFTEDDYDKVMNINVKAVYNVTQCVLPHIVNGGSIVSMSSLAGLHGFHEHAVYSSSKAAVDALTRTLAIELGPRGIRVNTVCPTAVLTSMGRAVWTKDKAVGLLSRIPLNRFGEVKEVTDAIVFFLSDSSSFINGHHLPLEGGFRAC